MPSNCGQKIKIEDRENKHYTNTKTVINYKFKYSK